MNDQDFNKLNGLLSKLSAATRKASKTDGSFKKYHTSSVAALQNLQQHLSHLEQGLRTAKIVQ